MFVDLVVTQQGLRLEPEVEGRRRLKREVGGFCRGAKVAPGSSYFPSWGPAGVKKVTERELVSLNMLYAPHVLIGYSESVLSMPVSCEVRSQRGQ